MKKTLKKSPVIAFAEVLCQRAVAICSAANTGEDPEIIIKAWDGSFEEEIKRVTEMCIRDRRKPDSILYDNADCPSFERCIDAEGLRWIEG